MKSRALAAVFLPIIFFPFFGILYAGQDDATLHIVPTNISVRSDDFFEARVIVSSPEPVNAISGKITYPAKLFDVVSIDTGDTLVDFWISRPSFSNVGGKITFEGITLNPGFQGTLGQILSITFRAKRAGSGEILFDSASVLANDGKGTNLIQYAIGSNVSIGVSGNDDAVLPSRETFSSKFFIEPIEPDNSTNPRREFGFVVEGRERIDFFEVQIDGGETLIWDGDNTENFVTEILDVGNHHISVTAVDSRGRVKTDSLVFQVEPLNFDISVNLPGKIYLGKKSPICILGSVGLWDGGCFDSLVINGRTFSDAEIFIKLAGDKNYEYRAAAANGVFSIPFDGKIANGEYEVYAQAVDKSGAKTGEKKIAELTASEGGSGVFLSNAWVILVFVLIILVLLLTWHFYNKLNATRMRAQKEAFEAKLALRYGIQSISDDVSKMKSAARSLHKKGERRSSEEEELLEKLIDKIKEEEGMIEKEIDDIEGI